jgi:hypothetical protein
MAHVLKVTLFHNTLDFGGEAYHALPEGLFSEENCMIMKEMWFAGRIIRVAVECFIHMSRIKGREIGSEVNADPAKQTCHSTQARFAVTGKPFVYV